jgi:hypothetical protein
MGVDVCGCVAGWVEIGLDESRTKEQLKPCQSRGADGRKGGGRREEVESRRHKKALLIP